MMKANNDENTDEATNGVLSLYDGQKNYPALKIHVEYSIVEHVQYNCIEVIGVCLSNAGGGNAAVVGGSRANSRPGSGSSPHPLLSLDVWWEYWWEFLAFVGSPKHPPPPSIILCSV